MRALALVILTAGVPVLAQTNYGTITFTNKSGDVISNAVVTKVEAGKLTLRYTAEFGGGVVAVADLPEGLRARFGSSPDGGAQPAAVHSADALADADRKQFAETKAKAEKGDAQAQAVTAVRA
ncbi:MAG: hypothetical protein NT154_31920 [Verrucomicrobia bacterium]|nr:hypothetical protein [Verrucomicrobiota bacterium]